MKSAKSILYAGLFSMVFISITLIPYSSSAQLFTLGISKSGDGQGVIKSAPLGIDCGIDCQVANAQYNYKLRVTLTVKSDSYSTFLGWGGACQARGIKPTCTMTMDSDKNVTASLGFRTFPSLRLLVISEVSR